MAAANDGRRDNARVDADENGNAQNLIVFATHKQQPQDCKLVAGDTAGSCENGAVAGRAYVAIAVDGDAVGKASAEPLENHVAHLSSAPHAHTNDATNSTANDIDTHSREPNNLDQQNSTLAPIQDSFNVELDSNNKTSANYSRNEQRRQHQRKHQTKNNYKQRSHANSDDHSSSSASDENHADDHRSRNRIASDVSCADQQQAKCRQLSYVQVLFLRKWPFLAIAVVAMASLCFAILISTLTVYLLHSAGSGECSALAARLSHVPAGAGPGGQASVLGALSYDLRHLEQIGGDASALKHSPLHVDQQRLTQLTARDGQPASAELPTSSAQDQSVRLPSSVEPSHYELFVQPHLREPFEFDGKVTITVKCLQRNTRNITVNAAQLTLRESSLKLERVSASASELLEAAPKIVGLKVDEKLQLAVIELADALQVDAEYALSVEFVGQLNNDLAGFYKMRFKQPNSTAATPEQHTTSWIAATQFQPTDARRAFPCFDEPIFKATFGIKIKHWKNMTALSNMPLVESADSDDKLWVTDTFAKSAKMSTYLVAFAVTNFESRSQGNISVWTRPGLVHTAEYALKIAVQILRHYETFFGTEFPLPKMDMIALPDFNAGAMENWGLITYRETAMLYDSRLSTVANKERVATVVAHELAHQWFGNLVTPKWWDDLWLNEGFATYVEYIGVDFVEPQWHMMDAFVVEELHSVLALDSMSSSHRISIPVHRPDEIHEIFDQITYSKGASIIRMMNAFLTDRVFKLGLQRYLSALKYSNADQSDLWRYLVEAQKLVKLQDAEAAKNDSSSSVIGNAAQFADASRDADSEFDQQVVDVESVMNTWTLQSGYPIVTLTRDYDAEAGSPVAFVRQEAYVLLNQNKTKNAQQSTTRESPAKTWEVPITYTWKSAVYQNETHAMQTRTKLWLHKNSTDNVKLPKSHLPKSNDDWILLNLNQVGFYRVNYDMRNWQLLAAQLASDHKKIRPVNRAQLISDMFELARNSMLDYKFVMNATRYLKNERNYLPWYTASHNFQRITELLERKPVFGLWKQYMSEVMESRFALFKQFSFTQNTDTTNQVLPTIDEDSHNDLADNHHKSQSLFWLCKLNKDCQLKATSAFDEWKLTKVNKIDPTLRKVIYCTSIANGDESDWDFLWHAYLKEQSAVERDRIIRALGCSNEAWILNRYLNWTFDKNLSSGIRRQDGAVIFTSVANNNHVYGIAFQYMRENWQTILDMFGHQSFGFSQLVESSASRMNTRGELNEFKRFFDSLQGSVGSGQRAYTLTIEELEANVAWMDTYYPQIEQWLKAYYENNTSNKSM